MYDPLVLRFKCRLASAQIACRNSVAIQRVASWTRLPRGTLLLSGAVAAGALLLISPGMTINAIAVFLPISRTMDSLDQGAEAERRRWWDYWFVVCTAFLLEQMGVQRLAGGYWLVKLVLVLWLLTAEPETQQGHTVVPERPVAALQDPIRLATTSKADTSQALSLSTLAKSSERPAGNCGDSTSLMSTSSPGGHTSPRFPITQSPSGASARSQYSSASSRSTVSSTGSLPSLVRLGDDEQARPGVITTLDDLLELDFLQDDDASPVTSDAKQAESHSGAAAEQFHPASSQGETGIANASPDDGGRKPSDGGLSPHAVRKPVSTLDDLLELDFGAE